MYEFRSSKVLQTADVSPATASTPHESAPCTTPRKFKILTQAGFLVARDLTSEVVLLVYSQEFKLGVLLYLPQFSSGAVTDENLQDQTFAQSAIAMILSEFRMLGVVPEQLLTYVIGGSGAGASNATVKQGVQRSLRSYGLTLSASDLGGSQIRSIWMDVASGRTIVRTRPMVQTSTMIECELPVAS